MTDEMNPEEMYRERGNSYSDPLPDVTVPMPRIQDVEDAPDGSEDTAPLEVTNNPRLAQERAMDGEDEASATASEESVSQDFLSEKHVSHGIREPRGGYFDIPREETPQSYAVSNRKPEESSAYSPSENVAESRDEAAARNVEEDKGEIRYGNEDISKSRYASGYSGSSSAQTSYVASARTSGETGEAQKSPVEAAQAFYESGREGGNQSAKQDPSSSGTSAGRETEAVAKTIRQRPYERISENTAKTMHSEPERPYEETHAANGMPSADDRVAADSKPYEEPASPDETTGAKQAHSDSASHENPHYSVPAQNAANPGSVNPYPQATTRPVAPQSTTGAPSSGKTFLIAFAGALAACVLAFAIAFGVGAFNGSSSSTSGVVLGSGTTADIDSSDVEASLAEAVAEKCLPSVVSIDVYGTTSSYGNSIYDYLYGYGYGQEETLSEVSLGSGVMLTEDGYIVTNYHVIESGTQYQVTVQGEVYDAELVGSEASSDIAVLKVTNGSGFTPITIGDSDNIKIGEWVMSIGSPFGLEQSVATGIVSATSRSQIIDAETDAYGNTGETTIYPNMIQTDAAINPGNSGGALVNANGELIGINTLITSYSGNYSGVGFAIPSNYAVSLANSIISGEEPTHAQLGITMTTINSSTAQRYGFSTDQGAYVTSVADGSAAQEAGMQVGDIIVAFDGQAVSSASDVMLDVRTKQPGDEVTITVERDGQTQDLNATLGSSDDSN